jgi:hypothetical protein
MRLLPQNEKVMSFNPSFLCLETVPLEDATSDMEDGKKNLSD